MSVAQFSPILRKHILDIYGDGSNKIDLASFKGKTRKQIFKEVPGTKDLRKRFEAADFHTSSLTIDGMSALSKRIVETMEEGSVKQIVANFLNSPEFFFDFVSYIENEKRAKVSEYAVTDIRLENVPQDTLKNYFIDYISSNLKQVPKSVIDNIRQNVQSGHLAGIFFLKLKVALGVTAKVSTSVDATYRDFTVSMPGLEDPQALQALDSILKAVLDADYLTSNLITESQVFIDATKYALGENPRLITELQFTADNEAAGRLLQQTGKYLNNLIQSASKGETGVTQEAIKKLIQSLQPVVDVILQKAQELKEPLQQQGIYDQIVKNANFLANSLINAPGSVTIKDGIGKSIASIIKTGAAVKQTKSKIKPRPIVTKHKEVINISKVAQDFKQAVDKVKKSVKKNKIAKTVAVKSAAIKQVSNITGLQKILDGSLVEQVKRNMGTGNRRDVLNLRSGRFAESVKVQRLSESRQGMITAFYTYMKNPYATFSQGGRQELPRSRDPKLLISKSIREIMQPQIANRMRAVLV